MFNNKLKQRIKALENQLYNINKHLYGIPMTSTEYNVMQMQYNKGLFDKHKKLEQIVAEVVDYVYTENK